MICGSEEAIDIKNKPGFKPMPGKCGTHFCYQCLQAYREDNTSRPKKICSC